jgi:hypothetical protein
LHLDPPVSPTTIQRFVLSPGAPLLLPFFSPFPQPRSFKLEALSAKSALNVSTIVDQR